MSLRALVETVEGVFEVDLETQEIEPGGGELRRRQVRTGLPRQVAAASSGSTVVVVVDARPPVVVSHDTGRTWRESGRGLPPGFAVAVSEDDPDVVVYAGRNRLYLSRDGARFWHPLELELPDVLAVELL